MGKHRDISLLTGNKHKATEIKEIGKRLGIRVKWLEYSKMELQADTTEEVAKACAIEAYSKLHMPFILEDSGLFIDALNGFPGVYSAQAFETIGNRGIIKLLDGAKNRIAYFKTTICYADKNGRLRLFVGIVNGKIAIEIHSLGRSVGFDPIFVPNGKALAFSELSVADKNMLSHRGRAFTKFARYFLKER